MSDIEEIRTALKEADARLVELQMARNKAEEAKAKAEKAVSKAVRLSLALVKSKEDEVEISSVPQPHVAGLFRSVSSEAGQFAAAR